MPSSLLNEIQLTNCFSKALVCAKYHEEVQNDHKVLSVNTTEISSREENEAMMKLLSTSTYSCQGLVTTFNCLQMTRVLVAGNLIYLCLILSVLPSGMWV